MDKVKKLTIYLGSKCNLNCAYCHRESDADERGVTDKLLHLISKCCPDEIRFMGGEPTLYMDDIKKVARHYPQAKFSVTTNGVFLSRYIEYFREHNFHITLSFDGGAENLRGFDPLTQIIDYPNISISTTLYHGNTDFGGILKRFAEAEKKIGRLMMFFPHIAHHTGAKNKEYALTNDDIEKLLQNYRRAVLSFWKDYEECGVINMRYKAILVQLWQAYNAGYEFGETYCTNRHCLKVNTKGEAFNCLYVRNVSTVDNARYMRKMFPACEHCEVYSMCGGACVQSLSHDKECYFYKQLYTFFKRFVAHAPQEKLQKLTRYLR